MNNYENQKVTVIVPIYNVENYIKKNVESILNQTHKNLEIILVDDGSPDCSGEICDQLAQGDSRLLVIHKNNEGVSEARNSGLKLATGEWISFVDGDDWLEPDFIEYMLTIVNQTNADMGYSYNVFTTRNREQTATDSIYAINPEKATMDILYPRMHVGCWNKIYRSTLIRDNNISFTLKLSGEGLHFAATAAQHAKKIGVGFKKVYNYRLNNHASALTKYNVMIGIKALENIKIIKKELHITSSPVKAAARWHIWKNYNYLLFLILATKSQKRYLKELFLCLINIPLRMPLILLTTSKSYVNRKEILRQSLRPVKYAKARIKFEADALNADTMV